MIIMESKFTPSINIKRDLDNDYKYYPTNNSSEAYKIISQNFKNGVHSYNIIGSYGTGKSAFLLALNKHLNSINSYFSPVNGQFNGCKEFQFIQVVGRYESLVTSIAREIDVESLEDSVYESIKKLQNTLKKANKCLVLVIDEFGKSLEYAAKNNPEKELYFIQRIAEYANDSGRNMLFITTLHQNFDAYALGLESKDRKEWEKVKGRLKEIPFNEPVEQMLDLVCKSLESQFSNLSRLTLSREYIEIIRRSNLFNLRKRLDLDLSRSLFPLEPLAASSLLISLQRYGQNERSLFSFISSNDSIGLKNVVDIQDRYYSLSDVFDYLVHNYLYLLQSKSNADFFKWRVIFTALDRVESTIEHNTDIAKDVIKILGLLSVTGQQGHKVNIEFIRSYLQEILNKKDIEKTIADLENARIIKNVTYRDSYIIYEGSDIDIEQEIAEKRSQIGELHGIELELKKYLKTNYVVAKKVSYETGIPRVFRVATTTNPIKEQPEWNSEIDGIINVVVSQKFEINPLDGGLPIVYNHIKLTDIIRRSLVDLRVVDKILVENELDKVARIEIINYKENIALELREYLKISMYSDSSLWHINGEGVTIRSEKELNGVLSKLIGRVYSSAPVYRNELINRSKLSGAIQSAKKSFINSLINSHNVKSLGYTGTKFPPDRTIYHSLLEDTGIHQDDISSGTSHFVKPTNETFHDLWEVCEQFIKDSVSGRRYVSELVDLLRSEPFKLKDGFIEFWIISYMFIKRDEYALYMDDRYIPTFSIEIGDLLFKKRSTFSVKGIAVEGVRLSLFNKYRVLINQSESSIVGDRSFQEIAKPFLVFYKQLSNYSKTTARHISKPTINFRKALLEAKELERTFFEILPKCFGYSLDDLESNQELLGQYADKIRASVKELRLQDDKLIERLFQALCDQLSTEFTTFTELRDYMQERYSNEMFYLLDGTQKSLHKRIHSQIPDKTAWISSIAQALIGKSLTKISDNEELLLYDAIKKQFSELDKFLEISTLKYDKNEERAILYQIQDSEKLSKNSQIILGKKDIALIDTLKKSIEPLMKEYDLKVKKGLLIQILKELDD
jgi:hypothetical protein